MLRDRREIRVQHPIEFQEAVAAGDAVRVETLLAAIPTLVTTRHGRVTPLPVAVSHDATAVVDVLPAALPGIPDGRRKIVEMLDLGDTVR